MDRRFIAIAARLEMHQLDLKYHKNVSRRLIEVVDSVRAVSMQVCEYDADVARILEITSMYTPMAYAFGYIFLKHYYPDTRIRTCEDGDDFVMVSGQEHTLSTLDKMISSWELPADQHISEDEVKRIALEWLL